MSEVIVLSDSNESSENDESKETDESKRKKTSHNDSFLSDFEFPEVQFHHANVTSDVFGTCDRNVDSFPNFSPVKRNMNELEESSLESSSENDVSPVMSKNSKKGNVKKRSPGMSDYSDNSNKKLERKKNIEDENKDTAASKKGKSRLPEERIKKQEQLAREKALKAIVLKKSKDIKPGECMKFMKVVIDDGIDKFSFSADIKAALVEANIRYSTSSELIPSSITWRRNIEESYVNESNKICTTTETQMVNHVLIIWNWDEVVTKVADDSFTTSISSTKALMPECSLTLVIYRIQSYFLYRKQSRNTGKNEAQKKVQRSNSKSNSEFKNYPEISKRKLETCLNEIQITIKCNSRLIESPQDLAAMVCQYTKAIAEIPYKLEKFKNLENKCDWYVMGDNRNTVRVDKDGNGLKRLWQQQLCQFNLSSLEIAEAICSVYPTPADLIETYMNCTHEEGMNLLKDVPIRRAAGPLTTMRKIGPELSKKVYIMFTSEDGEAVLQ